MKHSLLYPAILSFLFSCASKDDDSFCTHEYRFYTLKVENDSLTQWYTVRQKTNDTLIGIYFGKNEDTHHYEILGDNYQKILENKKETFHFIGWINDTIAIHEPFLIGADECHLSSIEGNQHIQL